MNPLYSASFLHKTLGPLGKSPRDASRRRDGDSQGELWMVRCVTRAGRRSNLGLRGHFFSFFFFFREELCFPGQKDLDREVTGKEAISKIQVGTKKNPPKKTKKQDKKHFRCDNKREQRVPHTQELDLTSLCTC